MCCWSFKKGKRGASLVAQWLGVCLPMQGTWVRALVWEDPTCRGAAQLLSLCVWSLCSAAREAAVVGGPRIAMRSGPACRDWRKPSRRNADPTQP